MSSASDPIVNRIVEHDTRFVRVEVDLHQEAFDWACTELVKKYPGTIDAVETLKSLVNQYLNSYRKGTKP